MRRFYCEKENIIDGTVHFDKGESKHIFKVLRLEAGEEIIVSAGDGIDRICKLTAVGENATAKVIEEKLNENEPKSEIVLFQAVIKNDKMDLLIQKVTELGISKIVPVICERTVVNLDEKEEKKQEKWQKIALEACKQCGRSRVPKVMRAVKLKDAEKYFKEAEEKIVCYEDERAESIVRAVKKAKSVGYFIGPEGGISENEIEFLKEQGFLSVSLGKRILRAETAAIATGAVVMALLGEMDV